MYLYLLLLLFLFVITLLVYGCARLLGNTPKEIIPGAWSTSYGLLLTKAFVRACTRSQGVLRPVEGWKVVEGKVEIGIEMQRQLSVVWRQWRCDLNAYAEYCRVCEYQPTMTFTSDPIPMAEPYCFPETQFMRHLLLLFSSPSFPCSPLGLIHVRQSITAYQAVSSIILEKSNLHCGIHEIKETGRGYEISVRCDVYASGDQKLLWSGITTVLSRNAKTRERVRKVSGDGASESSHSKPFMGEQVVYSSHPLPAPANVGWLYAVATGDYSPHHLFPWAARLVGYTQHMAHGMWTLSRALSVLQEAINPIPSTPLAITAEFKRPLFLPSSAVLLHTLLNSAQTIQFEVRSGSSQDILHLTGRLACI